MNSLKYNGHIIENLVNLLFLVVNEIGKKPKKEKENSEEDYNPERRKEEEEGDDEVEESITFEVFEKMITHLIFSY
jgi:hypothetical protein